MPCPQEADRCSRSAAGFDTWEPSAIPPFGMGRNMRTTTDGYSRSRVPSCGRRYTDAPTAVPLTVCGGGEFPPSCARQSSVVADARRTAVYTPFSLGADRRRREYRGCSDSLLMGSAIGAVGTGSGKRGHDANVVRVLQIQFGLMVGNVEASDCIIRQYSAQAKYCLQAAPS